MTVIQKHAVVPYSDRQMFELVNNIEDYPRFLPWCHDSQILSRTDDEVVATLVIEWKGLHKKFTTRNILKPYEQMRIELVSGPMQKLEGTWSFTPVTETACNVHLNLDFEFSGRLLDMMFQPIFHHIANTLVDAFSKRAVELYGVV